MPEAHVSADDQDEAAADGDASDEEDAKMRFQRSLYHSLLNTHWLFPAFRPEIQAAIESRPPAHMYS